jgi:uncharacterized membrane protein YeaQ/YmgE (transglycosylase-associated protein family)
MRWLAVIVIGFLAGAVAAPFAPVPTRFIATGLLGSWGRSVVRNCEKR